MGSVECPTGIILAEILFNKPFLIFHLTTNGYYTIVWIWRFSISIFYQLCVAEIALPAAISANIRIIHESIHSHDLLNHTPDNRKWKLHSRPAAIYCRPYYVLAIAISALCTVKIISFKFLWLSTLRIFA